LVQPREHGQLPRPRREGDRRVAMQVSALGPCAFEQPIFSNGALPKPNRLPKVDQSTIQIQKKKK